MANNHSSATNQASLNHLIAKKITNRIQRNISSKLKLSKFLFILENRLVLVGYQQEKSFQAIQPLSSGNNSVMMHRETSSELSTMGGVGTKY